MELGLCSATPNRLTHLHKEKHTPKKQHLVNSRYELKQQDNKFCSDISTLFQSHCQTRISYLQSCYHTIYKETGRDDV